LGGFISISIGSTAPESDDIAPNNIAPSGLPIQLLELRITIQQREQRSLFLFTKQQWWLIKTEGCQ
jgi:hypothetical protein